MENNNLEVPLNNDSEEINKLEDIDSLKAEIELLKEENSKTKSNLMWKVRNNVKVLVEIIKYPEKGKNAEGKIIEVLGGINEAGVDMLSLIKEYNLPYVFPENVINEAKSIKDEIANEELEKRLDLRNEVIMYKK